jgi:predicted hydrocarbon binding protein
MLCTYQVIQNGVQRGAKGYFKPLNIGRIMLSDRDKKIYGIVIESKVEKSALSKLCELADGSGVIVRYIQFSMEDIDKPVLTAIVFLDFSEAKVSPEQVLKLIRSQSFVVDAQLIKPDRNGIFYDNHFFPLVIAKDQRVVIFRKSIYGALFNGIRKKFGSAGDAMLYYQGFTIGFEVYNEYVKAAGSENLEDLIEVAKAVNMTLGWGIIDDVKINAKKGTAQLRIHQSFECELGKGSEKPYSQFYRGAIAGLFTRFFGKEVKVNETKCIAKGDPYCEFTVKR